MQEQPGSSKPRILYCQVRFRVTGPPASHGDILCQEAEVMQDISTTRQLVQTDSLMWVTLTIEKYRWDGIKADKVQLQQRRALTRVPVLKLSIK